MYMDNRIFNVNGHGEDGLLKTLELVFLQEGSNTKCASWFQSKESGLVLCWCQNITGATNLPAELTAEQCMGFITQWLKSEFAKTVILNEWCNNLDDFDGSTSEGWYVYCENWGHVAGNNYAICGIKPAYAWHGK